MVRSKGAPRFAPALAALAFAAPALAACAPPARPPSPAARPVADAAGLGAGPGARYARELEERRRGIGVPPALPPSGAVDRLPGELRASRPAPGVGPAPASPAPLLPVPGNALSRLSAIPASPLANPPGGFAPGRP